MKINIQLITKENLSNLLYKKLIEQDHNVVSQLHSYENACINYSTTLPDIVLLDLDIDNSNQGINLCRSIYNFDTEAKIIVFSDNFDVLKKSELCEIGVEYWLDKPLELSKVFECIDAISYKNNLLELRELRGNLKGRNIDNSTSTSNHESMSYDIYSLRTRIKEQRDLSEKEYSNDTSFEFDFEIDNSDKSFNIDFSENNNYNNHSISNSTKVETLNNHSKNKKGYLNLPVFINDEQKDYAPIDYSQNTNEISDNNLSEESPKSGFNPFKGFINRFKK